MIDLTTFAPENFKEHLIALDNKASFNKARANCELGPTTNCLHYVITGNEGSGIDDAVMQIYHRLEGTSGLVNSVTYDAAMMSDPSGGFANSMSELSRNNFLIHIKNADLLGFRGNANPKNGIEELCMTMAEMSNSVVVLSGKRSQLMELVKGNERAKILFTNIFHFDDLTPEAMLQYMADYVNSKNYQFDPSAESALEEYLNYAYKTRGSNFRNIYFLQDIFDREIVPKMSERVMSQNLPQDQMDLCTIMPEDLPEIIQPNTEEAINKLKSLVGLEEIKKQILDHTALVKLNNLRASKGIFNRNPPMHMVFTGNPGTGKTTLAKYIGEIYHSIGVLSSGHVVETERTKLVSEWIGGTEHNTEITINSASGGVLFIDEAYNLFTQDNDRKDFGLRVIETLLTYLSADDLDMIVILAGYTEEMNRMLEANPGMKSRFPYIFHFEDYTPKELMQIGKLVLEREHYKMTPEAEKKLAKYVINEYDHKDEHFGNGRFITRLITTHIIPSLSNRLLTKLSDDLSIEELTTIEACDIPEVVTNEFRPKELDETILSESLERLDDLVSLDNAKQALHDFVDISRLRYQQGTLKISPQSLCWEFIGKTGTGKGTVAEILGRILQGLGILKVGQTVCVNADEFSGGDCYYVLGKALEDARDGLLFLDMDSPNDINLNQSHLKMWIINRLRELEQTTALVFGQIKAEEDAIAQDLSDNGIASYGNTIIFDDLTSEELAEILESLLMREYQLDIKPAAKERIVKYLDSVKASNTKLKKTPVNLRTIVHIAQTVAHITQLRIVRSGGSRSVTKSDVAHFKWNKRKVGFAIEK